MSNDLNKGLKKLRNIRHSPISILFSKIKTLGKVVKYYAKDDTKLLWSRQNLLLSLSFCFNIYSGFIGPPLFQINVLNFSFWSSILSYTQRAYLPTTRKSKNEQMKTLKTSLIGLFVIIILYSLLISIYFSGDNTKSILFAGRWKT